MDRLMKLLTNQQTADLLGIKSNTLEIWRLHGKGPVFRKLGTGKSAPVRYADTDVQAWLDDHACTSTSAYSAAGRTSTKSISCPLSRAPA